MLLFVFYLLFSLFFFARLYYRASFHSCACVRAESWDGLSPRQLASIRRRTWLHSTPVLNGSVALCLPLPFAFVLCCYLHALLAERGGRPRAAGFHSFNFKQAFTAPVPSRVQCPCLSDSRRRHSWAHQNPSVSAGCHNVRGALAVHSIRLGCVYVPFRGLRRCGIQFPSHFET